MPRLKTEQVRVSAYTLTRALRAAAAFTDANKKSHRHRICLRTTTWTDDSKINLDGEQETSERSSLIAAAGGPLRVITVLAGDVKELDDFAIDITPGAAALIVKLFSAAGEVELKHDGKTLTVTATDTLFDNRRIEVRALKPEARSDALLIAQRLTSLTGLPDWQPVSITHEASVAVAAAAKALGAPVFVQPIFHGNAAGAELQYASIAVGYTRAHLTGVELSPAWGAILDTGVDDEWRGDLVTLQHLLDGALPRRVVTIVPGGAPDEPDSEPIDLDNLDTGDDPNIEFVNITPAADAFADEEVVA
jgi:hypothetical protein